VRQYQTTKELESAIKAAWSQISLETIKNLLDNVPNRLFQIIHRNGDVYDY
jgi:hypothetical protein